MVMYYVGLLIDFGSFYCYNQ